MIFALIALILCYLTWCLEGGHSAVIIMRIQVGLMVAATIFLVMGIIRIASQLF